MFRCPTSELPICPRGRPTASSEASIVVCAMIAPQAVPVGLGGAADRVVGRIVAATDAVENQQHDGNDRGRGGGMLGHRGIGDRARGRKVYAIILPLSSLLRPRAAPPTSRADTPIPAEQLAARPGHARLRIDAGLAVDQQPAVRDARNRGCAGDPADQSQGRADPRFARGQGIRGRPSSRTRCTSRCLSSPTRGQGARQVHRSAADRVLRARQSQPERGGGAGQARVQGDLRIARRAARLGRGGIAAGEGLRWRQC